MRLLVFGHVTTGLHSYRCFTHCLHVSSCFPESERCPQPISFPALRLQPRPGKTELNWIKPDCNEQRLIYGRSALLALCLSSVRITSVGKQPIRRQNHKRWCCEDCWASNQWLSLHDRKSTGISLNILYCVAPKKLRQVWATWRRVNDDRMWELSF